MSSTEVSTQDAAVARALATPTRASILDYLRLGGPRAVREVAEQAGIHANVARGHLDVLVAAGLAHTSWRRHAAGGRPAKVYEAAPVHVEEGPALVSEMLAVLIETAAPAPGVSRSIAVKTGERLARRVRMTEAELTFEQQVEFMVRALAAVSGGVRILDKGDDWVEVEDFDCPFKGIAVSHPELACSLDKALKEGIMNGLGADVFVEQVTSIAWGDPTCREVVRWRPLSGGEEA
ncbi:MAG: helix-turn-helix domain-containing protein [Actinomycetota bacterium]